VAPRQSISPQGSRVLSIGGCGPVLAVPSRVSQRLPHLQAHDVAEIDAEVREALTEIGNREAN
jgi:phage terminase Nu1 subunit (DNA packaging protein)